MNRILIPILLAAVPLWAGAETGAPAAADAQPAAGGTATEPAAAAAQAPAADAPPAEAAPAAQAAAEPLEEQAGFSRGSVTRSVFTSGVSEREPVDRLDMVDPQTGKVFYFTELRDMAGQTATHRWEHDGKVMAEVTFDVRGPRWRVWSSKNLDPSWTGEWKVSVLNGAGEVIAEDVIQVQPAPAPAGPATAEPAADRAAAEAPAPEPAPATP